MLSPSYQEGVKTFIKAGTKQKTRDGGVKEKLSEERKTKQKPAFVHWEMCHFDDGRVGRCKHTHPRTPIQNDGRKQIKPEPLQKSELLTYNSDPSVYSHRKKNYASPREVLCSLKIYLFRHNFRNIVCFIFSTSLPFPSCNKILQVWTNENNRERKKQFGF